MDIIAKRSEGSLSVQYIEDLAAHCVSQISGRVQGLDRDTAWRMYNGAMGFNALTRNPACWGADLFPQLTGAKSWEGVGWHQAAGKIAITRRHLLQCSHWSDSFAGQVVGFTGANGEYFQTTIAAQYPTSGQMAFDGRSCDLEVYYLAAELPSWVHIMPLAQMSQPVLDVLPTSYGSTADLTKILPLVVLSQKGEPGDIQKLYVNNSAFYDVYDGIRSVPPNGGLENYNKRHPNPNIYPYFYDVYTGDSGMPVFLLVNSTLYLSHIVTGLNFGLQPVWEPFHAAYINELIVRADTAAGVSTGYTVTVAPSPI